MSSNKSKILVYGANGWIGSQFVDLLKKNTNIEFFKGIARVDKIENVTSEIESIKPSHIVSFIGRTHGSIGEKVYSTIDYLEQKGKIKENVRDNLFSPLVLAMLCKERNIHYTYLGTGCIFSYDETHPFGKEIDGFEETSQPNFFGSSYSVVKGYTDQLMHLFENSVLNLRIRMPITESQNPRNFITKITNYEKICSIPNSMTVLPELLPVALDMLLKNITGTYNLTNPGLISHNEMLTMFQEIVDPSFTWKNFTIEEQNKILSSERSNNFLNTNKLSELYPSIKNIKTSVRDVLLQYKESYIPKSKNNITEKKVLLRNVEIFDTSKIDYLLVTGGCGFIGSNFINIFHKKYPHVKIINFDSLYYCASLNNIENVVQNSENYTFVKGNLQDFNSIKELFESYNISHIIHFAAQSHVQNSFQESLNYTNDNIVGTHNLLENARLYGKHIQRIIHVSTDEVYGESSFDENESTKTEQSILCPTNPYAATKAGAELIAQSYCHSFKMPIIITRGNNVYGPNQYPEKVVPKFITQLLNNQKVTIQGDGSCIRAFLHVNDCVSAFEHILFEGQTGEIYNIGCDEIAEISIMELSKILIEKIHNTSNYNNHITYIEDRPFNDKRYYISNQKVKNLGWSINVDFETGISELIELLKNKIPKIQTITTGKML